MSRLVIKVGSNVLTKKNGKLDITRVSALVDQIAWLIDNNHQVILVSSGAVASGRGEITIDKKLDSVAQRQLFSAVGQVKLINLYYNLFREHNISIAQVLTMKENFSSRYEYLNQRGCMSVMLDNGVLPIVNENDTVSVTELMFTDNDELSGLIATMMGADMLIILSNVDGIYDGDIKDKNSKVIREVAPGRDLSEYIRSERSGFGRGGMITKCRIATKVADEGVNVIIANGKKDNILVDLVTNINNTVCTKFIASNEETSSVKRWIAHSNDFAKGGVKINDGAKELLLSDRVVSLLPIGVIEVVGEFEKGDIVNILDANGGIIGVGRTSCSSAEARESMGVKDKKPIIHYDYLYIE